MPLDSIVSAGQGKHGRPAIQAAYEFDDNVIHGLIEFWDLKELAIKQRIFAHPIGGPLA
jgi:hypothetical protein